MTVFRMLFEKWGGYFTIFLDFTGMKSLYTVLFSQVVCIQSTRIGLKLNLSVSDVFNPATR